MYYKVMNNNMVIDLLTEVRWVRYLPVSKRLIATDSQSANGIMGSDNDSVYHILGRPYTFDGEIKSVSLMVIDQKEYEYLSTQRLLQQKENQEMKNEIASLKEELNAQSAMLKAILDKLS